MLTTFAHPHIRIRDIEESLDFYCRKLGFKELSRRHDQGFTLIYLAAPGDIRSDRPPAVLELAHVEGDTDLTDGSRFAHVAYYVDDLETTCADLASLGVIITIPPQPLGYAYIVTPDGMTIELLATPSAAPGLP